MTTQKIDYWSMSDTELAAAWREADVADYSPEGDPDGVNIERLNFVEDAILQRIAAPDNASGDDPRWQARIREYGRAREGEN